MASRDISRVLKYPNFRWLWIGSLGSSFAMNMQIIARGWLVYELTSSEMDLAYVTISFMLPTVLFSLWGGVLADRFSKRLLIIAGQALNCVATLVMAMIILNERVEFWDFIWFGFFNGAVLALSMPARQAYVPELVPERLILAATSLNTTGWNLSRIVGPAFAGLLIALIADGDRQSHFGVGVVYLVIAALYLISAVTMGFVRKPSQRREGQGAPVREVMDAFVYVWQHPPVFALIVLSIIPFLFGMPLNTLLPAFNEDVLRGGPDDLGFLISAMGCGAIVGSLVMAALGGLRRKGLWVIITCLLWGGVVGIFGLSSVTLLALPMIAAVGFVSSANMSLNRALLQMQVEPEMRGRILSIDMMSHGLMPLGVVPVSLVAEVWGVQAGLAASGGAFIVLTVLAYLGMRSVRHLDRGLDSPTAPQKAS